eukprot:snap_masked-scaffold_5-processed-gene-19.27-mRNA-1 protein AED:1.00 eAED:1.00 QI:0/0/0/0/1/1/2/0/64
MYGLAYMPLNFDNCSFKHLYFWFSQLVIQYFVAGEPFGILIFPCFIEAIYSSCMASFKISFETV